MPADLRAGLLPSFDPRSIDKTLANLREQYTKEPGLHLAYGNLKPKLWSGNARQGLAMAPERIAFHGCWLFRL